MNLPRWIQPVLPARFRTPVESPALSAPVVEGKALSDKLSTFWPRAGGEVTFGASAVLAFTAYWVAATRWRAQKLSEAPLMVVAEDQESGDFEWIPKHPLAPFLESPHPDLDMAALIRRTSHLLDNTGAALWVIDVDRARRPKRATPFGADEFDVESTADRIYGQFRVNARNGQRIVVPAEPGPDGRYGVYLRDYAAEDGWIDGRSRFDVAADWLQLSDDVRKVVQQLVVKAPKRMLLVQPDHQWNPTEKELDAWKESVRDSVNAQQLLALLGGGSATILSAPLTEVIPGELLNRIESIVSSVAGVPAIVLQFEVGLQNAPWSQMSEARKMAYADTIQPGWKFLAGGLTRQLLRKTDPDPTHSIQFDTSDIAALQIDRAAGALMAMQVGDDASLNERRSMWGGEPDDDPDADIIPALKKLTDPTFGMPPALAAANDPNADPTADDPVAEGKRRGRRVSSPMLHRLYRDMAVTEWNHVAKDRLNADANAIGEIVQRHLAATDIPKLAKGKAVAQGKESPTRKIIAAVTQYLDGPSSKAWAAQAGAIASVQARRSGRLIAAEVGFSFELVDKRVVQYAAEEAGFLTESVGKTTADTIRAVLEGGFEEGASVQSIANTIRDAVGIDGNRAQLIARTESARIGNGAPQAALQERSKQTGLRYAKTWRTAGDARVRDEHDAMEGETVGLHDAFSNGETVPASPNCRCIVEYTEIPT